MADETKATNTLKTQDRRHRSPNYPVINLREAVERVKQLNDKAKIYEIPEAEAHILWGYKALSGNGFQLVAALKGYGLLDIRGSGTNRFVKISEDARRIILDSADAHDLIKKAALAPLIHLKVWEKFGNSLPPDVPLRQHLLIDLRFNPDSVGDFISELKETISFANLAKPDILPKEFSAETENKQEYLWEIKDHHMAADTGAFKIQGSDVKMVITRDYAIPRKEGRLAILRLEYPISSQDISQIRKWLDLMGETLPTEGEANKITENDQ